MDASPADPPRLTCTAFDGTRLLASGGLAEVALAAKGLVLANQPEPLIFDDATGRRIELDLHGSAAQLLERAAAWQDQAQPASTPRRGRPNLGVIAREVTLLPRHWDWLAAQPGSASQVLRRLIDQARQADPAPDAGRLNHERAYRVITALAGDLAGFEEASRALFASDHDRFVAAIAPWPQDLRDYVVKLATG